MLSNWPDFTIDSYPELYSIAMDVLATQPSSESCERMFSVSGKVTTPQRARLSASTVKVLTFLSYNNRQLKKLIENKVDLS